MATPRSEISLADAWKAYPGAMQALVDGAWMGTREMTFYAAGKVLWVEFSDGKVIRGSQVARSRSGRPPAWTWRQSSF